jgi:hypothetical protein
MASYKIAYAASAAVTISPASLASSATFVAGRESTLIDNTSNLYLDYLLAGKITVGTSPTDATHIQVCVVGIMEDSTWPDVFDGTDSAETVTNTGIKNSICKVAADITVTNTSDVGYPFGPISVAACFGGSLPKKFVVFVTHNTVAALHATPGNHTVYVTGVYATIIA